MCPLTAILSLKDLSKMALLRTVLTLIAFVTVAGNAAAQTAQRPDSTPTRVDPRSPRAIVEEFLSLTRQGQFGAAGPFLGRMEPNPALRARQLKAILDQHLSPDLDLISSAAEGDTVDGLPTQFEQIGAVRSRSGVLQPIRLIRNDPPGAEPAWVFAPTTVSRIPAWYDLLGARWLRERMPLYLQQPSFLGVDRWQWVVLLGLLVPSLILGWLAGTATVSLGRRAVKRTKTTFDDRLLKRIAGPIRSFWAVVAFRVLVEFVGLSISAENAVSLGVKVASAILITWLLLRATHVLEEELPSLPMTGHQGQIRSFAPLIGRVARIFIFAFGAIAVVAQFGYTVTTLLTGLGIGGIAIAFAAQKTIEHPFGSIALGLDQPIRVGDWVRIGEISGEVETIGLRSTRIRTMERTLVVFPNGRLAEQHMENFGVRDRILLKTVLRLRYDTDAQTIRRVRDEIRNMLVEHPLVWPERIIVAFNGFGDSSLDLDVIAWLSTTDYNIFREAREEIYLKVMDIISSAGATLVNNVQTLVLQAPPASELRGGDLRGDE
jgi:MscS family membrane protein